SPAGSPSGYRVARSARHSARIAAPPFRWIAPSTPPPPRSDELAALTIASTACCVMSPWRRTIRGTPSGKRAPLVLVLAADLLAARLAVDGERSERARREIRATHDAGEGPSHRGSELEALAVAAGQDEQAGEARDRTGERVAVRRARVETDPRAAGRRALERRDARHEPHGRRHELVKRRRRELGLSVEGLAAEPDRVLVSRADEERVADFPPIPLFGGVVDRARHLLEPR